MNNEQLLVAARAGDHKAFKALVVDHRLKAWNVCLRICGNHADAEDALQVALVLAWRNLGRFRGEASFGTWFYRIASNSALDLVRRSKDEQSLDQDIFGNEVQVIDYSANFESQLADSEVLNEALSQISLEAREALVLHTVAGLKMSEIATHQNSSASAVKVRIHRAKKKLAAYLGGRDLR